MDKQIKDREYRFGKMPALTQFHVLRRLAPVLAEMNELVEAFNVSEKMEPQERMGVMFSAVGPVAKALAKLSDEDANYIIFSTLGRVQRKEGDRYAPVTSNSGALMYEDIELDGLVQLTIEGLKENYGNFFDLLAAAAPS